MRPPEPPPLDPKDMMVLVLFLAITGVVCWVILVFSVGLRE
jgi:hypothetical protein